MEQRLSLITLGVASVPAARAFYQPLGWKPSSIGGDEVAFFQLGGIALSLYGREALAHDANLPAAGSGFSGITLAYNVREKSEVDTLLAKAQTAGARILKPAQNASWGGYHGYFADPDGHAWEVAWNPGFAIKEDGTVVLPA